MRYLLLRPRSELAFEHRDRQSLHDASCRADGLILVNIGGHDRI